MEINQENKTNTKTKRLTVIVDTTKTKKIKRKKRKKKICRVPLFYSDTSEDENKLVSY